MTETMRSRYREGERNDYCVIVSEIAVTFPFAYKTSRQAIKMSVMLDHFGDSGIPKLHYDPTNFSGVMEFDRSKRWATFWAPRLDQDWYITFFRNESDAVKAKLTGGWDGERIDIMSVINGVHK